MTCSQCNAAIAPNSGFCGACGGRVASAPPAGQGQLPQQGFAPPLAPPPQGPAPQQGFAPPPGSAPQQGFAPPQQQGYAPPQPGSPPSAQQHGYAQHQQGYPPPQQQGYPPPPQQHGYVQQPQGYPPQQPQGYPPQQQQGFAPPQPGYQPPQAGLRRVEPVTLNAATYITMTVICTIAGAILVAAGMNRATQEALPAVPLPFIVAGIFQMTFLYKMWKAIDDGVTRPTPGAAVGYLFIPFFSIIWIFIAWGKFAGQYNQFIQRHQKSVQPLESGIYIAALLLGWIPVVGLVLWCMVLSKTAAAVNALSSVQLPSAAVVRR